MNNKNNSDESNDNTKKDLRNQFHQSLSNILNAVVKTKNKYQQDLIKLKMETESLHIHFESNNYI